MNARSAIGVDVGGTTTRLGLVDAAGTLVDLVITATPRGADALATHLIAHIESLRRRHHAVDAYGVGVPGRIDPEARTLSTALNLEIWDPTPLWTRLEDALEAPVLLCNDVDMAALGAYDELAGGTGSLAYLNVGTGLASGLVLDGTLHRGRGGAGEIGHLPVPGGELPCTCGQRGCAETMASGRAMLRAWGHPELDVEALWNAADGGVDPLAAAIRSRCIDTIAWLVQCAVMLLDVDTVAIGGGVSRLGERLRGPVVELIAARAAAAGIVASFSPAQRIRIAPVGAEYGVVGAARTAQRAASDRSTAPSRANQTS